MATRHLGDLLHRATHRISGVPAHAERPAGHQGSTVQGSTVQGSTVQGSTVQGSTVQGRARHHGAAARSSLNHRWNHSPGNPPRFGSAWQRRIAALFRRELG